MGRVEAQGGAVAGLGLDLLEVERIAGAFRRHGERLLNKVCSGTESGTVAGAPDPVRALALRFAVKEACLKAMGTGWAEGLSFRQVEVVLDDGRARVGLWGAAAERAQRLGATHVEATVRESGGIVAAMVVLVRPGGARPDPGGR